jgi:retron-type reverse transcriptase
LEEVHYETTVPTVRDRVVQMAAKMVMEPVFEADFQECSYDSDRRGARNRPWKQYE